MLLLLIVIAVLMVVVERLWPGQALPESKSWWLRIAPVNLAQIGVVVLAGVTWDRWFQGHSLFALASLDLA